MPEKNKDKTWLVAAWPGMGNVAVIAAGYLVHRLGMKPVDELPSRGYFDIAQVNVRAGIIATPRLPRSQFYRLPEKPAPAPSDAPQDTSVAARNLIIFLGESQPSSDGYGFAHALLDRAAALGAHRIVTFASMASQLHPSKDPRVFGAATNHDTLADLKRLDLETLNDGQIGGLNGVLLGAAAERGLSGLCLLGEIPFFGAGVPNPKAARAVLEVFGVLSGVTVDLSELARDAQTVDRALIELLEKMQAAARRKQAQDQEDDEAEETLESSEGAPEEPSAAKDPRQRTLDPSARARIEHLFSAAGSDRSKAVHLKEELDRLGVFGQFEDRFLDLFKRGD